ncbi:hypothetical protein BOX15_Mlig021384g3 [Macrostomum lignano]|uniref:Uncharacterized protein n=2 Tax=Macrostomum lignano TaxID=282301 RepID=A0A267DEG2_9PLAT|nr:hypothetical protein BOX15_Mlig021384g3 [Macrostomum lignano]
MAPVCSCMKTALRHLCNRMQSNRLQARGLRQHLLLSLPLIAAIVLLIVLLNQLFSSIEELSVELHPDPELPQSELKEIAERFSISKLDQSHRIISLPVTKKIHFMYKGYKLDVHFAPLLKSWRKVYPEYRMYFWTDDEIDLLISRRYPAWQDMYTFNLSNYMERSDTARAFVLHAIGGWYADLDTGCLSRADGYAARHALILPLEPYLHALNNFRMRRLVSNAIMYSAPGHPFWMFYLELLRESLVGKESRTSTTQAAGTTGPVLLTHCTHIFQQANKDRGCPGSWCPHLPPPVKFLPHYDDSFEETRQTFWRMCTSLRLRKQFDSRQFEDECRRLEAHEYLNAPLDPTESHTYHEFYHLNEKKSDAGRQKVDARKLGLDFVLGNSLVAEIEKL